ncbi:MAG: ABC transporter permease [Nocardioides sp.]|jgi:ABC-2 type transport system permease protein
MSTAMGELDTLRIGDTPAVPFMRLVGVEVRKMYDTLAGRWLLAIALGLGAFAQAIALIVVVVQDQPMKFSDFTGIFAFVSSILLPVVGIMLVTSEWSQRTAMTTFTLEPRRGRVIGAKLAAGLVLTFATILIALISAAVCNALYGAFQGEADWQAEWRVLGAFALTQSLAMIGGFALACLFLNTPAAIVVYFVYKWVLPSLIAIGSALMVWFADFAPWIDFQAAQGPLYDGPISGEQWGQLLVSGFLWLVLPLGLGIWRILRAEVK